MHSLVSEWGVLHRLDNLGSRRKRSPEADVFRLHKATLASLEDHVDAPWHWKRLLQHKRCPSFSSSFCATKCSVVAMGSFRASIVGGRLSTSFDLAALRPTGIMSQYVLFCNEGLDI